MCIFFLILKINYHLVTFTEMLRVASGDFVAYTEFEEDILFDEDDPDFAKQQDALSSLSLPLVIRGKSSSIISILFLKNSVQYFLFEFINLV